ncbi:MAG: methylenetetrahydrofolate reductase [NAD(P)H] [Planctomycetota bacterium]
MHIQDLLANHSTTFSFEFFPPKGPAAAETLYRTIAELSRLKPAFVSVTYGAGGSTRELTHDLVERIKTTTQTPAVPHLTCVCHSADDIRQILERYAALGVSNLLALGGDPPHHLADYRKQDDDFQHAADLVKFIRDFRDHPDPRGFGIGVAGFPEGHPATPNRILEMDYLKAKVDAGADYICTQLFFDNRDFYDFRERCVLAGIHVPVLAGLMPITSARGMKRMAELAAGSRYPAALLRALQRCDGDEPAVANVGTHWATEQARDLLDHDVAGIHFYTLNQSRATQQIYRSLGVADSTALDG